MATQVAVRPPLATITKKRARPRSQSNIHTFAEHFTPSPTTTDQTSPMTISILQALSLKSTPLPTPSIHEKAVSNHIIGKSLERLTNEEFVTGLVLTLQKMMDGNEKGPTELPDRERDISVFYSTLKQPFGLGYYIGRLVKHMQCSRSVFIAAIAYLQKIKKTETMLGVCELNIHRLLVTAATLAAKWLEDEVYCNEHYQRIGGVPTLKEFNKLETVFLNKCQWRLHVPKGDFAMVEEMVVEGSIEMLSECDSD